MVLQEVFSVFYKINPTFSIAFDADHASACSFNNNPYKLCKAMPERNLCLYKIVQFEKFSLYEELYNDLNATRAVSTDTWMMWWETCFVKFSSTWHTVLKKFVRLFWIQEGESVEKSLAGAIYKEKRDKWRQKVWGAITAKIQLSLLS